MATRGKYGPTNGPLVLEADKATFGRCPRHRSRVYYWKKARTLALKGMRCPDCGRQLAQTTTLFHGPYIFIPTAQAAKLHDKPVPRLNVARLAKEAEVGHVVFTDSFGKTHRVRAVYRWGTRVAVECDGHSSTGAPYLLRPAAAARQLYIETPEG